jgi:hypothetical protein
MLKLCSVELPRALGHLHLLAKPVKHAAIRQLRQERRRPHTPAIVSGPAHTQKIHAKGSSQCMERTKRAAEGRHSETPAAVRSIAALVSASISSYARQARQDGRDVQGDGADEHRSVEPYIARNISKASICSRTPVEVQPALLGASSISILSAIVAISVHSKRRPPRSPLALSVLALSCAPSANTTRTRGRRSGRQLIHTAAGSNGALRAAGPGKVAAVRRGTAVEAGRESGRSGFGALKRHPAHDPATARLPIHTSRFPPTHSETPHSYARRPKAAASAADASRSRHRAAETSLQRQLPRAHYASLWAASSARAGQLSPNAAQQAGGRVAATIPPPPPAQGAAAPSSLSPQYWAISRKVPK